MPRDFTPDERALLEFLLADGVPNVEILRAQLATARYDSPWYEGSMCFNIAVSPDAPRVEITEREAYQAVVASEFSGPDTRSWDDYAAEISLWVEGGILTQLEYSQAAEEAPTVYPPLANVRVELGRN